MELTLKHILGLIIIGFLNVQVISSACLQKNSVKEAPRDIFICRNQMFESGKKIADPENCQCYYQCSYRQQPCYYCCPDGQHYNAKLGCVIAKTSNCVNRLPQFVCPPDAIDYSKYAHKHCRKYWECVRGRQLEMSCDANHHWDDRAKACTSDLIQYDHPTNCSE